MAVLIRDRWHDGESRDSIHLPTDFKFILISQRKVVHRGHAAQEQPDFGQRPFINHAAQEQPDFGQRPFID